MISSRSIEIENVVISAPGVLELRRSKLSRLGPHDVMLKVKACAICGSDLHTYRGMHPLNPLPATIGHELSGEISEVGERVSKVKRGDRVCVEPMLSCGKCYYCQRGHYNLCKTLSTTYRVGQSGFAEYFVVSEKRVHVIPDMLSFEEATMIEPLAVSVHAVRRACLRLGDSVAILGAGTIGLLLLQVARAAGASRVFISDTLDCRLDLSRELGADYAINAFTEAFLARIMDRTEGLGVDVSFEAVGLQQTLEQALRAVRKNGTVIVIGVFEKPDVEIPANLFMSKELVVKGSFGYCWDFQGAIEVVGRGLVKLKPLITHVMDLEEIEDAFRLLIAKEALKIVIRV